MNQQERDEFAEHLHKVAQALNERVDSVRIVVTLMREDGSSQMISRGAGNWYAQFGSVKEWVAREEERTRADERRESDEGESV